MMAFRYAISGLVLSSEIELLALSSWREGDDDAHVVRFRVVRPVDAAPPIVGRNLQGDAQNELFECSSELVLRAHGHADFAFNGDSIVCTPRSGVARETIEQLLLDQVLPKVLHLRGKTCLHASAILMGDGVVAFLARSGSGKSTLAASYVGERALISDDCLALDIDATSPDVVAHPSYPSIRLCHDAAEALDPAHAEHAEVSPRMRWKIRMPFDAPSAAPLHLRAAYVLEVTDEPPSIVELRQRDAFMAFASHVHRLDPADGASLARETETMRELALRIPVGRLAYPRRFEALPIVRALIEANACTKVARR
jgi:hypothetical protein